MKKLFYLFLLPVIILFACDDEPSDSSKAESLYMGSGHLTDIYYCFAEGETGSYTRAGWDIAFSVPLQTATIIINEGAGVRLYAVGDTTTWSTVDTSGIAGWKAVYNDKSDWMNGAFNRFATGFPNYGWGTYDHGNTYSVWGDSIYVIRLTNGELKKLFIRTRVGQTDTYVLRWADIDGSNQVNTSFSPAAYQTQHFIQYSLVDATVIDAQPDLDAWDLLFTMYIVPVPIGPNVYMDYPVVGVLMNQGLQGMVVSGVDPEKASYSDAGTGFSDADDVIGWEWKVSDPVTHAISLADSTSYFIKVQEAEIYRIYFTEYNSDDNGKISFNVKRVE
jgi:hypothetical protein